MYVCIYVFIQVRVISIPYLYPFLPTNLPTKRSSILISLSTKKTSSSLHRSPFLIILPRPARACAYVCVYMNLWKDSPPCPVLFELRPVRPPPFPPRKKDVRFGGFAPPPSPCDGSLHIQSQLDKARQASYLPACLPACKRIKKKIRTPHPTMSRC